MPLTLGVRYAGKTVSISLDDGATAAQLSAAIERECGVEPARQLLKGGVPPRPLDVAANGGASPLADLGVRDRDRLILDEIEKPPGPLAPEAVGEVERCVIPSDNSCLFSSIITALGLQEKATPQALREVVRAKILSDPGEFDIQLQAETGKDSAAYAEWICKSDSWGGFVDLHILSTHLDVQICAIDIKSGAVHSFPHEPVGDSRLYLLFDGIHYDCIVAKAPAAGGRFSVKDDLTMSKAVAVAMDLKEKKQYTDTAHFTLQCQHCFKLLTGEKDAQDHAKETGHFNFQEAPKA
mmetsp:Transcript_125595/g.361101  ORF Transcript_125595/g.361101 Transcript_125595/m.361101 type:complete len:295 (+) Transcript_125595:49-933(+)|eukprot:CAMPEP_0170252608 /NCGR_PEP_ID=MMETSP0116_2-20130129/26139_1 /TAXON_ID=400756 /ORGANISM="Durinskia baltica, Strain CSIRO CS-38" /LENGTH=294 /DNA_ID=CAMNT_0010503581 /DNA_START=41 /DNA_END=925 /DNA_ORIENTATION=+